MKEVSEFHLRQYCKTKISRGTGHYFILELTGKIQDLQNELNCMNDAKDFQDAESIRRGNSHVNSRPVSFPLLSNTRGIVKAFFRIAAPQRRAAKHLGHTWYIGNVFANPDAS